MKKEKLGQESAFASACANNESHHIDTGMSKRFYAACAAMQGLLSGRQISGIATTAGIIIKSYELADELLKQETDEQI